MIFATGSRVYGVANRNSDWDFCVPVWELNQLVDEITAAVNATWERSDYNAGVKITFGDMLNETVINLIPLHPYDFVAWYHATAFMKQLPEIEDRNHRHRVFEHLIPTVKDAYDGRVYNIGTLHAWAADKDWNTADQQLKELITRKDTSDPW